MKHLQVLERLEDVDEHVRAAVAEVWGVLDVGFKACWNVM